MAPQFMALMSAIFSSCRQLVRLTLVVLVSAVLRTHPESASASTADASIPVFRTGVLPVLTKAGCNSGACHGAATGQGGFKLSLLGYDPEQDFARLTRELGGRRVDTAVPEASLMLRKASDDIDHEGGPRLPRGSSGYELARKWIAAGAPQGPRDLQVTSITVQPDQIWFKTPGDQRNVRVTARLSDGSRHDATGLALFSSNDDAIATVARDGTVTASGRGLASIMIRYSGQVAAARVALPLGRERVSAKDFPARNFIDDHVRRELDRFGVRPAPLSGNAEFLRRVHLDLAGRLPAPEIARAFLRSPVSLAHREQIIDQLLASEEFTDHWTMKFADLLLLNGKGESSLAYYGWLRRWTAQNARWDLLARELLTASGSISNHGPANFFTLANDPRDLSEHASRIFLGTRLGCARCHAHPSDRWTQDDYHAFAAYFARVTRSDGVVQSAARGEVDHPKSGKPMAPKPLGTAAARGASSADRRTDLAAWIATPENPLFARALVNRVWAHLFGRGLIEPVDDLRPTNPATHPELLEALAADFTAHQFDLRRLIRLITQSRAYQLASGSRGHAEATLRLYAEARLKPLSAPVFADAIAQVTGVADDYEGYPKGTRAVQITSPATVAPALDVLGRCARKDPCETFGSAGGGLAQALHLINGATINGKFQVGWIDSAQALADDDAIDTLYLRSMSRLPQPKERSEWKKFLGSASLRKEALQDMAWIILNSREFAFNH